MKRAFTMLELVLVIVVVGIISAVMVPRINNVQIDKAAQQVLNHIRYTQHLAMMDNQFDPDDPNWYKKRWQIHFATLNHKLGYTIYRDLNLNGNPSTVASKKEVAKNPLNSKQLLTSRSIDGAVNSKEMILSEKYKIQNISFSSSCSFYGSKMISFDYLGRPLFGRPKSLATMYRDNHGATGNRLVQNRCIITITDKDHNSRQIAIEPETGYTYIL